MKSLHPSVGIDVSSDELILSFGDAKSHSFANSAEGCKEILHLLPAKSQVHLETSGGYERLLVRTLRNAGHTVNCHNALRAKRLAQATGGRAKTDALDAKALARTGPQLPTHTPKSPEREDLADLSRAISELKEAARRMKTRSGRPGLDQAAKELYERVEVNLRREAQLASQTFSKRVKEDQELWRRHSLALSVRGVGPELARVCLCELPEDFQGRTPGEIASFAGLAPMDDQSGRRRGASRIRQGNDRLKAALYMPAMSTVRCEAWAKNTYTKLITSGRNHRQAIIAVMRKLLLRIVAVLKRGTPWQNDPPQPLKA